ncbi:uridine kinase [Thiolinea disciformis]|uniref:uridine kinase n=1 Tax=Thiolinea disciformis TaxID=125614 RepID=UPI000372FFB2|nr:uridine kinase [Thiolinea disciformis]
MTKSVFIGVCGGSGSGKSYLARALAESFMPGVATTIGLDAYYWPKEKVPEQIRGNYDHPDALEGQLIAEHLKLWRKGDIVYMPQYDFARHDRHPDTVTLAATPVMIIDSFLLFSLPMVVEQLSFAVFVDAPADVRLARRLARDVRERGRSVDDILEHYFATVRPMHEQFVEPHKNTADLVVCSTQPLEHELAQVLPAVLERFPVLEKRLKPKTAV